VKILILPVLLTEPLPASPYAVLVGVPKDVLDARLDILNSVLSIPSGSKLPVRLFHLPVRDFLVYLNKRDISPFWMDEEATHEIMTTIYIKLLLGSCHLRKDIRDLGMSDIARLDVNLAVIELSLPADVRDENIM
jgi:hypothetical protein